MKEKRKAILSILNIEAKWKRNSNIKNKKSKKMKKE